MTSNSARLAVVSGASGGIGRTIVDRLVREGFSVLCLTGQSPPPLNILRMQEGQMYAYFSRPLESADFVYDFSAYLYDLLDNKFIPGTTDLIDLKPELLVIAHGAAPALVPSSSPDVLDAINNVFDVDVMGAAKLCNIVGQYMLDAGHGSIALVSSLHAYQTYPARLPYAIAKSAMLGMSRALAVEWGGRGVRTNVILPWQVLGSRTQRLADVQRHYGEDLIESYKRKSPMRRLIHPEEIADAIMFLHSTPSANGVELVLDGGVSQSMWYQPFVDNIHDTAVPESRA